MSEQQPGGRRCPSPVSERGGAVRTCWMGFLTSGNFGSSSEMGTEGGCGAGSAGWGWVCVCDTISPNTPAGSLWLLCGDGAGGGQSRATDWETTALTQA